MKPTSFLVYLFFSVLVLSVSASQQIPVAVSPGSEVGIAKVAQLCPTFSWTAMDWATAYRVEVFKALGGEVLGHKEMAFASYPVLVKEILGAATSWTPSIDEQLNWDDIYVWYVQAIDDSGSGVWSQGRVFRIEAALGLAPIEEALNETLEEHGVDREIIDEAIDNIRAKASGESGSKVPAQINDGDPNASIQAGVELDWKTSLGYLAGDSNTSNIGNENTYIGESAGKANVTGDYNTFIGANTGQVSTSASNNTFVGYQAGWLNTANSNTCVGFKAGNRTTSGSNNTFIGNSAGLNNITGTENAVVGSGAGTSSGGSRNTYHGYYAGHSTGGDENTFIGYRSGDYSGGNYNTYIGANTGGSGSENTFVGYAAGSANSASNNTFMGYRAGVSNTTGTSNTFIGYYAGQGNTTFSNNTFVGYAAGYLNSGGTRNTFIGNNTGYANSIGYDNTFLGYAAGESNTIGYRNTFIGSYAGHATSSGDENTFFGYYAGYSNSVGNYNTFMGFGAGDSSNADGNTFLGHNAGQANTSGIENVYVGLRAGNGNITGNRNVFMGNDAGNNNTAGSGNVFLGWRAGYNETGSNRLYIDNSSTAYPLIYGDFANDYLTVHGRLGVGTKTPGYPMEMETSGLNAAFVLERTDGATNYMNATASFGNFGTVTNHPLGLTVNSLHRMVLWADNSVTLQSGASCTSGGVWTDASSRDLKENIEGLTTEEAIDVLGNLDPVKYNYKADKEDRHIGFIAEDVPDLVASKDRRGMSPMDVVAVLTKVLQEQQKLSEKQQKTIDDLRHEVTELKAQVQQK
jgi:hypothetical protein